MAFAKKCDRCGKLYEPYPTGKKTENNALRRVRIDPDGYICSQDNTLDLCPECMAEFNKWMIGGKFGDARHN